MHTLLTVFLTGLIRLRNVQFVYLKAQCSRGYVAKDVEEKSARVCESCAPSKQKLCSTHLLTNENLAIAFLENLLYSHLASSKCFGIHQTLYQSFVSDLKRSLDRLTRLCCFQQCK